MSLTSNKRSSQGSWNPIVWAVITALTSFTLLFLIGYGLSFIEGIGVDTGEVLAYIFYNLVIGLSCYLICRRYPKSILYVPIVANIMGIFSSVIEPNFWVSRLWVLTLSGWVLSFLAALIGYLNKSQKQ